MAPFLGLQADNTITAEPRRRPSIMKLPSQKWISTTTDLTEDATSVITMEQDSLTPLVVAGPHTLDARKIFVREDAKSRRSVFETPQFRSDLRALMATQKYQSRRGNSLFLSQRISLLPSEELSTTTESALASRKSVSFIDVTIREYPIVVGDNPAVSQGPPLTISWEHESSIDIDIDMYEQARQGHRRKQQGLKMDPKHRQQILRAQGFTLVDMQKGSKSATIIRNRRKRANLELEKDDFYEHVEKVMVKVQSVLTLGHKKRQEKQYLMETCLEPYEKERALKRELKQQKSRRKSMLAKRRSV